MFDRWICRSLHSRSPVAASCRLPLCPPRPRAPGLPGAQRGVSLQTPLQRRTLPPPPSRPQRRRPRVWCSCARSAQRRRTSRRTARRVSLARHRSTPHSRAGRAVHARRHAVRAAGRAAGAGQRARDARARPNGRRSHPPQHAPLLLHAPLQLVRPPLPAHHTAPAQLADSGRSRPHALVPGRGARGAASPARHCSLRGLPAGRPFAAPGHLAQRVRREAREAQAAGSHSACSPYFQEEERDFCASTSSSVH